MIKKFLYELRKGSKAWRIPIFSILAVFLCIGTVMLLRYFFLPQPTALPDVPSFTFTTSTPNLSVGTPTTQPNIIVGSSTPIPTQLEIQPTATATSFSFLSWIFPNLNQGGSSVTATSVVASATSVQVVLIPATKTNTPSPSPSPQPTVAPISHSTTCKNILYPARPGSQWTYFVNTPKRSGDVNMNVISVDGQLATVDAFELSSGSSARTYVQCDQDVILNFPLLSGQKLIGDMVNGSIGVDYLGGVLAPNEAAFIANNWALSWVIQYRVSGNGMINFNGRDFDVAISPSTVQMTCQTLSSGASAFESVTVFAGTFNALKVICRGDGQVTATVNGSQVTGTLTAQATQWFAPNIGLLRSQSDYAYLNVFGISIPLNPSDISGTLELRNYVIGQ